MSSIINRPLDFIAQYNPYLKKAKECKANDNKVQAKPTDDTACSSDNNLTNATKKEEEEEDKKTYILKIKEDNGNNVYYNVYRVNEKGEKTFLYKVPVPKCVGNHKKRVTTKVNSPASPLFTNKAVIDTTKSKFNFNQKLLKGIRHSKNTDEMMELLQSIV